MSALAVEPDPKTSSSSRRTTSPTRMGVRLALAGAAECFEAGDADQAVEVAVRDRPNVCLVDFDSPERSIQAAAEITAKVLDSSVVVMTPRIDEDEFITAIRAGAIGYLSQGVDPLGCRSSSEGSCGERRPCPGRSSRACLDELRGHEGRRRHLDLSEGRSAELTAREWEVVTLLRQGPPDPLCRRSCSAFPR
jgi:Response regulator containing a CheY-like receiver domain and an HTH DNA-binding domain